jgi:hypothetical protein
VISGQQWSPPCDALRSYIRVFAQRNIDAREKPAISAVPARLEQLLNFEFGDKLELHLEGAGIHLTPEVAIVGPQTHRRCDVLLNGKIESFGIFFQPSGFSRLFRHPIRTMVDSYHEAHPLVGRPVQELRKKLGDTQCFLERIAISEAFLLNRLNAVHRPDPMMEAADYILTRRGALTMRELADRYAVGLRQLERKFTAAVGYPPKLHARIARFQTALDMKIRYPEKTWRHIAHVWYHDQMHMVHDLRSWVVLLLVRSSRKHANSGRQPWSSGQSRHNHGAVLYPRNTVSTWQRVGPRYL